MRLARTVLCLMGVFCMSVVAQQASVTVKMNTYTGMYAPRNVVAIWVTNQNNSFIKTLKVNALPQGQGYRHCLAKWLSHSNSNVVDAVTSASNTVQGTRTATWDCTDRSGNEVPDGTYRIYYEMCEANGYVAAWVGPWDYIEFTKGTQDATVDGGDTWFTDGWTDNPNYGTSVKVFENARVTYTSPVNTPGEIRLGADTYRVREDDGPAVVTVTRSGGSSGSVSVQYTTSDGSARSDRDYTAASGTLTWSDGETGDKTFTVAITDDNDDEVNESVMLLLNTPGGGAVLGTPNSAVLTIIDDEGLIDDPDLECHWDFDGTVDDLTGKGNDGTLVGGPTYGPGVFGTAIELNGSGQYVDGADLDFPSAPFSISVWFTSSASQSGPIVHKLSSFQNQNFYIYPVTSGGVMCGLWDGNGWQEPGTGSTMFNDGAWHHVAMVVDPTDIELYVDGVSYGTAPHDNSFPTNDAHFLVGRQNDASVYFDGAIDELRIYSRALSTVEVAGLAQATDVVRCPQPAAAITQNAELRAARKGTEWVVTTPQTMVADVAVYDGAGRQVLHAPARLLEAGTTVVGRSPAARAGTYVVAVRGMGSTICRRVVVAD